MINFKKGKAGLYIVTGHNRPKRILIEKDHQGLWYYNDGFAETPFLLSSTLYEAKFKIQQMCKADKCAG